MSEHPRRWWDDLDLSVPPHLKEEHDRFCEMLREWNRPPELRVEAVRPELQRNLDWITGRCERDPNTRCWNWKGAKNKKGYGRIKIEGKLYLPHRMVAYCTGKVPTLGDKKRMVCVMHLCDNPSCCNPDHLEAGTMSENMMDCAAKGRAWAQQPEAKAAMSAAWKKRKKR